jgi:cobaltochelatase CobS
MTANVQNIIALVRCALCDFEAHSLASHIVDTHEMSVDDYMKENPGALLFSATGRDEFERNKPRRAPARKAEAGDPYRTPGQVTVVEEVEKERTKRQFSIRQTFGIDMGHEKDDKGKPKLDAKGEPILRDRDVMGYTERTQWTPKIEPGYIFPPEETKMLLLAMELKDRALLVGDTGTGKTSLVEQVAARLNYNVVKVNFDGCITRQDLVGEWVVKGKEMYFQYGILPHAFKMPGTIIILDEWDTISAECSFVLQRPLQKDDGQILILETGGELVPLHEDNVIIATANTNGQGDDSGLYSQGTKVQNYAQLNRFGMTLKISYLKEEQEVDMLSKRFKDLKKTECTALVRAINAVRDAYTTGTISAPLSTRDLINWAEKYILLGDPKRAAKYCFLNRMTAEDAVATEGIIQRVFDT